PKHEGPVSVTIDVFRALPNSRPKRVAYEPDTVSPDADNIAKAVLDGLNGIAYEDDRQVVELHVRKHNRMRRAGDSVRFSVKAVPGA
ncbi:RusA family crossover junction endodeoxyribonuclease, partial [Gordonibacter sp.]|uniref:RusA family crossover junction endodeoxyribonuclease n=1 Tax=Gordonibacter sp. TaxID=1968902 RepID=UPI002FCC9A99